MQDHQPIAHEEEHAPDEEADAGHDGIAEGCAEADHDDEGADAGEVRQVAANALRILSAF